MSRSDYSDDISQWDMIRWRGAVSSGIRGARGQKALREMLDALDNMPVKALIKNDLICEDGVCALGALAQKRGIDVSRVDPDDSQRVALLFGLSEAMVREIVYINDEASWFPETPKQRFNRVREWVAGQILEDASRMIDPTPQKESEG